MNNLIIRGPIFGFTGYSTMTRSLIKSLYKIIPDNLSIHPVIWETQQNMFLDNDLKAIINHCRDKKIDLENDVLLCIQLPLDLMKSNILKHTYCYTMLETDSISKTWVDILNKITGTIVPCKGNLISFKGSGVKNVSYVPLATDEIFYNKPIENGLKLQNLNKFNIFSFCQVNTRKNIPELISAFCDVFGNNSNVTLFLKIQSKGYSTIEMYDIVNMIEKNKTHKRAKIVLIYDNISDEELTSIYNQMDLYINTSFGESWDLPTFNAISCTIPAISTGFIGSNTYLPLEFRIKYKMVPIESPDNDIYTTGQQWAQIDGLDLRKKMVEIYNNKKKFKKIALEASQSLKENFSWDKSAQLLLETLGVK